MLHFRRGAVTIMYPNCNRNGIDSHAAVCYYVYGDQAEVAHND